MNREIVFRGKSKEELTLGEWIYGYLFNIEGEKAWIWNGIPQEVLTDTVGQYTGLKAIDGKEIYEGDIVKDKYENRYEVRYDDKRMSWIAHSTIPFENNIPLCVVTECTIIGNIHDNPELLEGEDS